jgi:predicted nucleic acid-binding protein
MGLRTLGLSRDAWLKAVELSCKGLSGYDATYLALAYDLQARWLTDDRKALKKSMSAYILTLEQWN